MKVTYFVVMFDCILLDFLANKNKNFVIFSHFQNKLKGLNGKEGQQVSK